eukprot:408786-Hanusia_phi.AAC.2
MRKEGKARKTEAGYEEKRRRRRGGGMGRGRGRIEEGKEEKKKIRREGENICKQKTRENKS